LTCNLRTLMRRMRCDRKSTLRCMPLVRVYCPDRALPTVSVYCPDTALPTVSVYCPDTALPTVSVYCQIQPPPPNFTTQPHSHSIQLLYCLAQRFTSHQPYLLRFPRLHVTPSQPLREGRAGTAKRPEEHTFFCFTV